MVADEKLYVHVVNKLLHTYCVDVGNDTHFAILCDVYLEIFGMQVCRIWWTQRSRSKLSRSSPFHIMLIVQGKGRKALRLKRLRLRCDYGRLFSQKSKPGRLHRVDIKVGFHRIKRNTAVLFWNSTNQADIHSFCGRPRAFAMSGALFFYSRSVFTCFCCLWVLAQNVHEVPLRILSILTWRFPGFLGSHSSNTRENNWKNGNVGTRSTEYTSF